MIENFEDKFMYIQTELISLCLEVTEGKIDQVFAYASIERESTMFNAFFEKEGKVLTINQLNIDKRMIMDFLKIGTADLGKIKELCEQNETKPPTEIKMYFDVKSSKYKADYKYNEICSIKTGISSGEMFMRWYNEIKENI